MSTGFGDPEDDFIQFLHDEWQHHTDTPNEDSEFNKFLFEFYKKSKMFGPDAPKDDPFGIHGI